MAISRVVVPPAKDSTNRRSALRKAASGGAPAANGWAAKTNPTILSDLSPSVQFEKVVEACGGYGQRIDDPAEVPAALERALHAVRVEKRQALINFVSAPMTGPRF